MPSRHHVSALSALVLVVSVAGCAAVPLASVTVVAEGISFTSEPIRLPAGQAMRLTFENRDTGVPHGLDLQTRTSGVPPTRLWTSDIQIGRSVGQFDLPALPAGPYQFVCRVHPAMLLTLDVA